MPHRVLHILSQRPGATGSGVTLDALVREAESRGWDQRVLFAWVPGESLPAVGGLPDTRLAALQFPSKDLPFHIPGMSDVMPYPSTVFSSLDSASILAYVAAWARAAREQIATFSPDIIHVHHAWLMATAVLEADNRPPVVLHGHGTDLRQMQLCSHLEERVIEGCRGAEALVALHTEHARVYAEKLGWDETKAHVVGAGFRDEIFRSEADVERGPSRLLYAGKIARSKGVDCLLEAVNALSTRHPELELRLAGGTAGQEGEALLDQIKRNSNALHLGALSPTKLADEMRRAAVLVLPSLYEGLPLVIAEALACGCRVVATDLPGIALEIAPRVGESVELVRLPPLDGPDRVRPESRTGFVERLAFAIEGSLAKGALDARWPGARLDHFRWDTVFQRVEKCWLSVLRDRS